MRFEENYYELLGITQSASLDDIHRAWRAKVIPIAKRLNDPDAKVRHQALLLSQRYNAAKACLANPAERYQHDAWLASQKSASHQTRTSAGSSRSEPRSSSRPSSSGSTNQRTQKSDDSSSKQQSDCPKCGAKVDSGGFCSRCFAKQNRRTRRLIWSVGLAVLVSVIVIGLNMTGGHILTGSRSNHASGYIAPKSFELASDGGAYLSSLGYLYRYIGSSNTPPDTIPNFDSGQSLEIEDICDNNDQTYWFNVAGFSSLKTSPYIYTDASTEGQNQPEVLFDIVDSTGRSLASGALGQSQEATISVSLGAESKIGLKMSASTDSCRKADYTSTVIWGTPEIYE